VADPYFYGPDIYLYGAPYGKLPTTTNQQVAQLTPLKWKKARQAEPPRQAV
jgi:hypothetical protein